MPTRNGVPIREKIRRIVIVAFDECQLLDVAGPLQTFASASDLAHKQSRIGYEMAVYSMKGGPVRSSSGLVFETRRLSSASINTLTTVVLSGGPGVQRAAENTALVAWIRHAACKAQRICSVCTGAYLLAATGLADGRAVATHWRYCDDLGRRYPQLLVNRDSIFVRDGTCWTSAGVSAGIDLTLALIEADLGRPLAMEVARHLVVYFKRPGGQAQFSELLSAQSNDSERFSRLHAWMSAHLAGDLSVDAMAEQTGMSPRNFYRAYKAATGVTPASMVEQMRVEAARRLLEEGASRIGSIVSAVGFHDDETMRRAFIRQIGIAPAHYQRSFSGARKKPGNKAAVVRQRHAGRPIA